MSATFLTQSEIIGESDATPCVECGGDGANRDTSGFVKRSQMQRVNAMSIRDCLKHIFATYGEARQETFARHPVANFLRSDFPKAIKKVLEDYDLIIVKGSSGQGNWARGPWAGIYNRLITEHAVRGYYAAYLFREDMGGVYLSLNQGMTAVKEEYRSDARSALKARSANFRAMLGPDILPFSADPIDLKPSATTNDTAFYELGNICSIYYSAASIPSEEVLIADLRRIVALYDRLIDGEPITPIPEELPATQTTYLDGGLSARTHVKIERNRKLVEDVKKYKGSRCEVCDLSFVERYGSIGLDYIEAHHLTPLARLNGKKVELDPVKDFAVLCANCHRMMHRMEDVSDIDGLRAILLLKAQV